MLAMKSKIPGFASRAAGAGAGGTIYSICKQINGQMRREETGEKQAEHSQADWIRT
jgi:galactokinase